LQNGASQSSVQAAILDSPEYWQQHGGNASGFVTALYSDVMGRTPGGQDTDYWAGVVQSRGQAAVVNGFLSSPEFDSVIIRGIYQTFLRRTADPSGLNSWINYLQANNPARYALDQFLLSPEYFNGSQHW
jgi:hypothetical protein